MENEDFIKLRDKVRQMRIVQKEYFKSRDQRKLMQSRRLEQEVDELLDPKPKGPEQLSMFDQWLGQ